MKTLLYIDDNIDDLELARTEFAGSEFTLTCANNPNEAVSLLKAHPAQWDIVAIDLIMSGDDGLHFAEKIEALDIGISIIFVSGVEKMRSFENYAALKDYKGFILKPLTPEKVCAQIESANG